MTEYSKIVNGKSYTVTIYEECAFTYWQSVNAKTGKGWQQHRDTTRFQGDQFAKKAMNAWMKAGLEKIGSVYRTPKSA